jgi:hypothetical protein
MPRVGPEPRIPVFELEETIGATERAACHRQHVTPLNPSFERFHRSLGRLRRVPTELRTLAAAHSPDIHLLCPYSTACCVCMHMGPTAVDGLPTEEPHGSVYLPAPNPPPQTYRHRLLPIITKCSIAREKHGVVCGRPLVHLT